MIDVINQIKIKSFKWCQSRIIDPMIGYWHNDRVATLHLKEIDIFDGSLLKELLSGIVSEIVPTS